MSELFQTLFIVLFILLFAITVGCCCHRTAQKRRGEVARRRATQQVVAQPSGYVNQSETGSVYIFGLRGASSTSDSTGTAHQRRSPGVEEDVNQDHDESLRSPDAIADSGPPPYIAVSNEPPPPSYEEAMRKP